MISSSKGDESNDPHQPSEDMVDSRLNLGVFDLWALGLTVVTGGQYFSWNAGLAAGFGSYLISTILMGTSYICLCVCNAEITSALPFAGGAYGIARSTLGLYPGFIIGCLEASEYIAYASASCIVLGTQLCQITEVSSSYIPVYSLVFYIVAVVIHMQGGRLFWRSNAFLGVASLLILLMYNLGSLPRVDFANAAAPSTTGDEDYTYFIGGMTSFVAVTPLAAWWYVGVESLNLSCSFVANPREVVGRASILCVLTLFATSIFTIFVTSSLPEAINDSIITTLATDLDPLNNGFMHMFNISYDMASVLSVPATFATAFGFIYGYGRVVLSMSRSGLFPAIFMRTYGEYKTPYVALMICSLISYILVIIAYLVPIVQTYLFNVCILSGFTGYSSQLVGFIILRVRYPSHERLCKSPLGISGAVYPILVFLFSTISVMGFQNDNSVAFLIFLVIIAGCTIYYFSYAKNRQFFSDEEKFIFVQQIVKFNERARKLAHIGTLKRGSRNKNAPSRAYDIYAGGSRGSTHRFIRSGSNTARVAVTVRKPMANHYSLTNEGVKENSHLSPRSSSVGRGHRERMINEQYYSSSASQSIASMLPQLSQIGFDDVTEALSPRKLSAESVECLENDPDDFEGKIEKS